MRSDLPSGTVTFLFTDIEGSTKLLHELGDRYAETLAEHRRVLREAFAAHGGVEVDTQGDAFFVAFARASDAVAAAEEAQRALAGGPVRVRMGVHTGEPIVTEEGYVGVDVHKGARVAAAGHGGQVLVSETAVRLLDGAELRDLGSHRLKDLAAPARLYQLGEAEFPPPKTLFGTNLPIQATPLVGRRRELEEAGALLATQRLVTLLGPGGSGKTRLALQLAADAVEDFPDGVFWVPLQAVNDPGLVEPTIARSLGARDGLSERIGDRRLLLLLDNFEHLLDAAAAVAELVARTPEAKLLVTSRAPLHVAGEHRYPVEPLPEDDAVALFIERAHAVHPGFATGPEVTAICRRLDGLPLALELAAARVSLLDAPELLARLERRLPLLTGGAREAPARHRTLQAAIAWSYELLEPGGQQGFARLAVFGGSFDLAAAEAVGDVELDVLQSLVDKSLLRRWASGRFGMLETIREFALERLDARGDAADVRRRHAEHFLELAERAEPELRAARQADWLALLESERDNLRTALTWARDCGEAELELRLATAVRFFWAIRGPLAEARQWLDHAISAAREALPERRADALGAAAWMAYRQADHEAAMDLATQELDLATKLEDRAREANALNHLANAAEGLGEFRRARTLFVRALALARDVGDESSVAVALNNLANFDLAHGEFEQAAALSQEAVERYGALGGVRGLATALLNLGTARLQTGHPDTAASAAGDALRQARDLGDAGLLPLCLLVLAGAAAAEGDGPRAARLLGAADRQLDEAALVLEPAERAVRDRAAARLRELATAEDGSAWVDEGRALSVDEAVELALSLD